MLAQSYLKECISYNPESGEITWRVRPHHHFKKHGMASVWNERYAENPAGSISSTGYRVIGIDGRRYKAHRLSFLYMTGSTPEEHTDHINGIRSDNRWTNLRPVTSQENSKNQKRPVNNTSGVTGVYWYKGTHQWRSMIQNGGKLVSLGLFDDFDEAVIARKIAEKLYGYHQNHGRNDHKN